MVSLGAIEAILAKVLPADIDILATAIPDDKKGEVVVLLYAGDIEQNELKAHIKASELNALTSPSKLIQLDAVPKLGSGKNDFSQAKVIAQKGG